MMHWFFLLLICLATPSLASASLQVMIDATPVGGTLVPPPGIYIGAARIAKPMVLDGRNQVILDGGGRGTVLSVETSGAVIRNLRVAGSGDLHDQMDAAIFVQGDNNLIERNVLDNVLFGIVLKQANNNRLVGNRIRSRHDDLARRGDAVRLWYSRHNVIEGNEIAHSRDVTLANSAFNRITGNTMQDVRYAVHLIFSPRSLVQDNRISRAANGIIVINSEGLTIRRNRILHVQGGGGAGIVFKESSSGLAMDNDIVHCSVGIQADSPSHPVNRLVLYRNRLAHNIVGINFYGEKGGHRVLFNRFEKNLTQATLTPGGDPLANEWHGNAWDDYRGFDLDGNGVGDTPYEFLVYADRIWLENPMAQFYRNAPALELLDFLERLAPFSQPELMLRDAAPQVRGK
jgi:nitrous oxidase accessory protein